MNNRISLNGTWQMDWLSDLPYTSQEEPQIRPNSDSAVSCPVPGYWEDLTDLFRTTALHTKLKWNPLYTLQRYPLSGYVPDTALPNPTGCFVYQKTVILDKLPAGETELYIGGAQNTVSAWINGQYLGHHEGYSAPFGFPVPAGILTTGENRITLAVSNHRLAGYMERPVSGLTSRAANECTGGIWGDAELRSYPDGLRDLWVSTAEDCSAFTVHINGLTTTAGTLRIYDRDTCICTQKIPAGQTSCTISTEGYTFWTPDTPKLYTAEITTASQTLSVRFGIRRLTVDGIRLYLNGEPYFFRGTCEHCYQPVTIHPTRDKRYYRMVLRKLKELGFNSIRFHTWVPPQEYMEAADALGMLMEIESPNNTTLTEWLEIVRFCRIHAAVNLYSTGNELQIDNEYETHLQACADLVHSETDSLFSPMSAMRGIEYNFMDSEYVDNPFRHNPRRLSDVGEYCDIYNSYSNALTSYSSASGTQAVLDERNAVYGKPLLSHEIGIHGTWIDLSLEDRYKGTRMGDTELFSSVRRHLEDKGLLARSNLYYRNSCAWQQILRKHCFETVRRCETFAGYDFLGDIDTHWHTFGYCVGMMNEFYELKPGETAENVLRYNSDTVLLADLPRCVNFTAGTLTEIPLLVSHYGGSIPKALLQIRISGGGKVLYRKELRLSEIARGQISELYRISFRIPKCEKPMALTLTASLSGGNTDCENCWDLYVFPKTTAPAAKTLRAAGTVVMDSCDGTTLHTALQEGKNVILFSPGPFASSDVSWQIALAGRTNGHLATVIADHPLFEDFPHQGYCGRQFEHMLNGSRSVLLDLPDLPHLPVLDIASSYKNAHKEAMIAEYRVGNGKLLICSLRLTETDPAACWLKNRILAYGTGESFRPVQSLTDEQFLSLCKASPVVSGKNSNEARNRNDITA
ncbi:MAG: beta galactosidase jelly roll domain-containing protein [Clostridia bacterium]|nr:beta galactosidase jelly roll domain-containing protein [Clostridia bacterium]